MPRQELPQFDEARCVVCEDCVAVCPADCLAMAGGLPWIVRPRECTSCGLCLEICPTDAVSLEPEFV
jgi:NAD-dependent dihydropyrimidine dehydrogenase PreA subunit